MTTNRARRAGPVNLAVLSEELGRSCLSIEELRAVCDVCVRQHRLDSEQEQSLRATAEAVLKGRLTDKS